MPPVFQDFQVDCRYGRGVLFKLRCDYSRFPSPEAVDRFVASLKNAGKIDYLTPHIFTNDPFIIDGMSVQIWANTYIAELPPWTGVTTLDSVVSKTKIYQYVTLMPDANDEDALEFDTYERAVELAKLAASIVGSDSPRGMIVAAPPALHGACTRFMEIKESIALHQTQTRGVKRPQVLR